MTAGARKSCRSKSERLAVVDFLQNARWVAADDDIVRYVFYDDRAGSDHDVIADGDAGPDDGIAAKPDIVADCHRLAVFTPGISGCRFEWMRRRVNTDFWGHHAIVADDNVADIKDDAIVIREKILADMDVAAVIAIEWRPDVEQLACFAKNIFQHWAAVLDHFLIEFSCRLPRFAVKRSQLRVCRVVHFPRQHFFQFCFHR